MLQMKEKDKTKEELSKGKIRKVTKKEFKVMIIKLLSELRRRTHTVRSLRKS